MIWFWLILGIAAFLWFVCRGAIEMNRLQHTYDEELPPRRPRKKCRPTVYRKRRGQWEK